MALDLMSDGWAEAVKKVVDGWPDDVAKGDHRKPETYWQHVDGKRKSFNGTFAFGVRRIPGGPGGRFLALTFDESGECTACRIVEGTDLASARLAIECEYANWFDIAGGYDIGKAMTYHKLPLVRGEAAEMLRFVYFVHELLAAVTRVKTNQTTPVPA